MSNPPVATGAPRGMVDPVASRAAGSDFVDRLRVNSEYVVIPLFALLVAAALFAVFLLAIGKSPVDFVAYVWRGGFGTSFSLPEHPAALGAADSDALWRSPFPRALASS